MQYVLLAVFLLIPLTGFAQAPDPPPTPAVVDAPEEAPADSSPAPTEATAPVPTLPFTMQQLIQVPKEIRVDGSVACTVQPGGVLFCSAKPK